MEKPGRWRLPVLLFLATFTALALSGCAPLQRSGPSPTAIKSPVAPAPEPTLSEKEAISKMGFDTATYSLIRGATEGPFYGLKGYTENGERFEAEGVTASVSKEKAEDAVHRLRPALAPKGYIPYITDVMGNDAKKITIIKGKDPYRILEIMQTNGVNYNIDNKAVIEKLKEWESRYSTVILGASMDWVCLEFTTVPSDLPQFAKEVYAFCPDSVDQGVGSVEALAGEIKKSKQLFLWWD